MVITTNILKQNYKNIKNKNTKISREIKNGKLFKLKNGLYETNKNTPGYLLAGSIYGPSYLSFDYALAYYNLIPEKVVNFTSATQNKKKKKYIKNCFGTFLYRDIPSDVYPLSINLNEENGYSYQIATPEKAICDKLYTLKPLKNLKELKHILFEDLRIDKENFNKLDKEVINKLNSLYHSTNINLLNKYMRRSK